MGRHLAKQKKAVLLCGKYKFDAATNQFRFIIEN